MGGTFLLVVIVAWVGGFLTHGAFWWIAAAYVAARLGDRYLRTRWIRAATVDEIKRDNVRLQAEVDRLASGLSGRAEEALADAETRGRDRGQREAFSLFTTDRATFMQVWLRFSAEARAEAPRRPPPPRQGRAWWDVLGVDEGASEAEAKAAYRSLAKRFHPDNRETADEARMRELNAAWEMAERSF